jgi:hypothetical protein
VSSYFWYARAWLRLGAGVCVCAYYVTKTSLQLQAKLTKVMKFFFRPLPGNLGRRSITSEKPDPEKILEK